MDLNVPTIAQRKAARRNQVATTESTTQQAPQQETSVHPTQQGSAYQDFNVSPSAPPSTLAHTSTVKPEASSTESTDPSKIDKETLIALARSLGLEVTAPKKIWIKHSYSVTPESKEKFANYCEVLGIKMQDGLEDAFQDWFKKKEIEFQAINEAKNG